MQKVFKEIVDRFEREAANPFLCEAQVHTIKECVKIVKEFEEKYSGEMIDASNAYEKGRDDTWQIRNRLDSMPGGSVAAIFGTLNVGRLPAKEVISKLNAYDRVMSKTDETDPFE